MNNSNEIDLICSVSSNGDCVALCTSDGVIKFYDTLTSNLKLEYTSSTHLQAACTCLSWSKFKRNVIKQNLFLTYELKFFIHF